MAPTPTGIVIGEPVGETGRYSVTQGPQWLADFLMSPPHWVTVALGLAVIILLYWVIYQHYQDPISTAERKAIVANVSIALCCGVAVYVIHALGDWGYMIDATGGWLVGGGIGLALARVVRDDQ